MEPGFDAEKEKSAVRPETVPVGPESMAGSGGSGGAAVVKVQLTLLPRALPSTSLTPELPATISTW